jgi:peptidoglycan/xylan/chitin deacetylase (PgdA/CDA1 family)
LNYKYIPILAYHALVDGDDYRLPEGSSRQHAVLLDAFWNQLDFLRAEGWESLLPRDLGNYSGSDRKRRFILTFDDGHRSDVLAAAALTARGYRAISYVPCDHIGKPGYMSIAEIRNLARENFGIGSHGLTHTPLTTKPDNVLREELQLSRQKLEDLLGREVVDLAIPFGRYDGRVIATALEIGFTRIMTSDIGLARVGAYKFPRLPVTSRTTDGEFRTLMGLGPAGAFVRRFTRAIANRIEAVTN